MACPKILNQLPHKTLTLVLTVLLTLFTLLLSGVFFSSGSNYLSADDGLLIMLIPEIGVLALALARSSPGPSDGMGTPHRSSARFWLCGWRCFFRWRYSCRSS